MLITHVHLQIVKNVKINFMHPCPTIFDFEAWYLSTELSGIDLFMADVEALETYLNYFYCISKRWAKQLPETYDPEQVSEYFNLRPHVVALRLLEVIEIIYYDTSLWFFLHHFCSISQILVNHLLGFRHTKSNWILGISYYASSVLSFRKVCFKFMQKLNLETLWEQFGMNWKLS